ncbi:MAG: TRAP transporter small permease subunit [Aestuariibacter sp.]
MLFVQRLSRAIDTFHAKLCDFVSLLTIVMTALTFLIVVLRYGFDLGWVAMQESVIYLHAAIFMLGAAFTLKTDGHVRVDVFYRKMSVRRKAWVNLFGGIFLLLPVCIFIFMMSWDYVMRSWQMQEASQAAGGLPALYLLKSFILLFAVTLVLQGISEIAKSACLLVQKEQS